MTKNICTENNSDKSDSQIGETVMMINVAVARIEHAMAEGTDAFTTLSESFVEIVSSAKHITSAAEELEDSPIKTKIEKNCLDISQRVGDSIINFQFYDKLSQRMNHVSNTLSLLTALLKDSSKIKKPEEWLELQNVIRSKFTLDADQKMFDAVLNGMSIEDALEIAVENTADDDIELF